MTQFSSFPISKTATYFHNIHLQLHTQFFMQVQWAMICHCDRNEYFQTDITVPLVFPDVLRKPPLPYRGNGPLVIVSQHHSWHSHKALTASSLKRVTQTTRTCMRGSSHTFKSYSIQSIPPTYVVTHIQPFKNVITHLHSLFTFVCTRLREAFCLQYLQSSIVLVFLKRSG